MVMYHVFLQSGETPLHDASRQGQVEAIDMLLNKGANINHTNNVSLHIIDLFIYRQIDYTVINTHGY